MPGSYLPPVVAEVIGEVGKFTAAMNTAKAEMTGLQAATTRLAAMGKVAMAGLGIAAAAVGYESVKLAMNFDQTMELLHTQAGAAQSEVDGLKDSVLALAPTVGIGPEKLAEGLYHIESTGYRGKEALDILTASAKLAAMGLADLDTVTYAMSGVMSVAMKDVKDAADATNYLNTIVGMGDMRMGQLAAAIGTGVLPSFKSAGLGMMDFGAALATITDNSTPADEAATRLRMTVALMSAPTNKAAEALASIGMRSTQMAEDMRKPNGLLLAVMDLKHHLESSGKSAVEQNQVIEHAFGGGRTSGAILTLLEESDRLASKYEQLGTESSRAQKASEAWAAQQKQFSQQWHELTAQLQVFGVKIGNWLIPKIQSTVKWMKENSETVKILAMVIGGILVVAIGAYTVAMIQAAIATIAATWPILLIIAAIALVVFAVYELVKHWSTVWHWIKRISLDVWGALVGAWHWLLERFDDSVAWFKTHVIDPIVGLFRRFLLPPWLLMMRIIMFAWQFAVGFITGVVEGLVLRWRLAWLVITTVAQWAWEHGIRQVVGFIVEYGLKPIAAVVDWLVEHWHVAWAAIVWAAHTAWAGLKTIWDLLYRYGITPIKAGIDLLRTGWDIAWGAIKQTVKDVWDFLRPIFDKIGGGLGHIKDLLGDIASAPGAAGRAAAHLLGFASGGIVPGPRGAPQLAIVHGGEAILSNDDIAAAGTRSGSRISSVTAANSGASTGDLVLHARFVMPDGRAVRTETLRYARRAGITPDKLYPASTSTLVRG